MATQWLPIGRIVGVFGVKGLVKVESYTEPREAILDYGVWHLDRPAAGGERRVLEGRPHGRLVVARLERIEDCDAARTLVGATIAVERTALPKLKARQYYQADLIGLRVVDGQGRELGRVEYFIDAPAHPVMVVRGAQEHWLPATPQHLRRVDLEAGEIRVDWDPAEEQDASGTPPL
jgi:16S rRNA processing protein RimM